MENKKSKKQKEKKIAETEIYSISIVEESKPKVEGGNDEFLCHKLIVRTKNFDRVCELSVYGWITESILKGDVFFDVSGSRARGVN